MMIKGLTGNKIRTSRSTKIGSLLFMGIILVLLCIIPFAILTPHLKNKDVKATAPEVMYSLFEDDMQYHKVTFLNLAGEVYKEYTVMHGDTIEDLPPYNEMGFLFAGWDVPYYSSLDFSDFPIYGDMTIEPKLLDEKLIVLNGLNIAGLSANDVDIEELQAMIDLIEQEVSNE